jgi:hypothetical protein
MLSSLSPVDRPDSCFDCCFDDPPFDSASWGLLPPREPRFRRLPDPDDERSAVWAGGRPVGADPFSGVPADPESTVAVPSER